MSTESPLLFISHKHGDKKIADVISNFVKMQSGGRVEVHQSSSPWANAPKIGRNLNQELRKALWRARALILIYTNPDHDWNYCMWECGVASHPESADSKLIVFQCAGTVPNLFAEQVNVNTRNLVDIQKFTNEFLTDPTFFPGFDGPITKFHPNGPEVASAAAELSQKLLQPGILPPEKIDPDDEWPAYPFIQFELNQNEVDRIRKSGARERKQTATEIIQTECLIRKADKYAEQLFGVPSFSAGMKFKELEDIWIEKHPNSKSKWVDGLSAQILDGVMWRFPTATWQVMQGVNDDA
jgi:hypothetical protein